MPATITIGAERGVFYDRHAAAEWTDIRTRKYPDAEVSVTGKFQHTFRYDDVRSVGAYDDGEYTALRNRGVPPILAGLVAARRYRQRSQR